MVLYVPAIYYYPEGDLTQLHVHCFTGSEGKLTIALQRVGMLSGIGAFSQAAVTGQSGQDVVSQITEAFIPVLKAESKYGLSEKCQCQL